MNGTIGFRYRATPRPAGFAAFNAASGPGLQAAPTAGAIVRDYLLEHREQCAFVHRVALVNRNCARTLVVVSAGDDSFRVRHDSAVIEKDVYVVFGRKQGTDIPVEHEIRLPRAFDRLCHKWISRMNKPAYAPTDCLLPLGKSRNVSVDS